MKFEPGTQITILLDDKPYETVIDAFGVQRFPTNEVLDHLFRSKRLDLNQLAIDYQCGKFSKNDYMVIMMGLGYSVAGFADLSAFSGVRIDNPLWANNPVSDTVDQIVTELRKRSGFRAVFERCDTKTREEIWAALETIVDNAISNRDLKK